MNLQSWQSLLLWVSTQWSWTMQQASRASQGFSPGQPLYMIPQYFPYLSSGGTSIFRDRGGQGKKTISTPSAILPVSGTRLKAEKQPASARLCPPEKSQLQGSEL